MFFDDDQDVEESRFPANALRRRPALDNARDGSRRRWCMPARKRTGGGAVTAIHCEIARRVLGAARKGSGTEVASEAAS